MLYEKVTTELFLTKAKKIHGDKYDYSLVSCTGSVDEVKIICPEHGVFTQRASNHLYCGCKKCGNKYRVTTTEEFINKSNKIHDSIYDYSLTKYIKSSIEVDIICQKHGKFSRTPFLHGRGKGCPKCDDEIRTEHFISKAKEKHGDKYNYSLVNYVDSRDDILIICKQHGIFSQAANGHLNGHGCMDCSGHKKLTTEEFIKRSVETHRDTYDYSKSNYINYKIYVEIICKKHGSFWQRPDIHCLDGKGCPICNESKGERLVAQILEDLNVDFIKQAKFESCKNKNHLVFDFWLEYLGILIEFNGKQHYKLIRNRKNKEKGMQELEERQHRDRIKLDWANSNNIPLLVIPYWEFDKNKTEEIVINYLCEHKNNDSSTLFLIEDNVCK